MVERLLLDMQNVSTTTPPPPLHLPHVTTGDNFVFPRRTSITGGGGVLFPGTHGVGTHAIHSSREAADERHCLPRDDGVKCRRVVVVPFQRSVGFILIRVPVFVPWPMKRTANGIKQTYRGTCYCNAHLVWSSP